MLQGVGVTQSRGLMIHPSSQKQWKQRGQREKMKCKRTWFQQAEYAHRVLQRAALLFRREARRQTLGPELSDKDM